MAALGNNSAADAQVPDMGPEASDDEVVLWVRLARGDPLTGSISQPARSASFSFHGWIDFMGAINALRNPVDVP